MTSSCSRKNIKCSLNICEWCSKSIKVGLKVVWTVGGDTQYQAISVDPLPLNFQLFTVDSILGYIKRYL